MSDFGPSWRWGTDTSQIVSRRLVELYQELQATARNGARADIAEELRRVRIDMERWVDLSVDLFDRSAAILRRLSESQPDGTGPSEVLTVDARAGAAGSADLWLHNLSDGQSPGPSLRCSGLTSTCGAVIEAPVRFDVDTADLAPRASRKVSVVVEVPSEATPGTYHGLILADTSPDSAIPLRVCVARSNGESPG